MVSVTASTFTNIMPEDDYLTATIAEYIIDRAIDLLNLYGGIDEDMSNMSGAAGSMTLTVEGYERGAIIMVARPIYYAFFKGQIGTSAGMGPLSSSDSQDLMANPEVRAMIKEAGELLAARRADTSEIEADVG